MLCAVVSFWSVFLIGESNQCDPEMDCFALARPTGDLLQDDLQDVLQRDVLQQDPLRDNCSEYEADSNYTIRCFTYTFNYVDGVSNAGGVFVVGSLITSCHLTWSLL